MNPLRRSLVAVLCVGLFSAAAASFAAEVYRIDVAHSSLIFRAKHMNTSWVYGRFDNFAGNVAIDEDPSKMSFEVAAQVDSINTGQSKRDNHLKGSDFFSAREFPEVRFKSTSVKSVGENKYEVTGDLTMHGQTRPVTAMIERTGASQDAQFGERIGFLASFTVKRSEFGMSFMTDRVSDEIEIVASFATTKPR